MSDFMWHGVFWLGFSGLVITMSGLAALLQTERMRSRVTLRLGRANGTGPARRVTPGSTRSSSFSHARQRLRQIILQMGERLAVILGGEARETAAKLSSAGYRGRDALMIYAFLKTALPLATALFGSIWVLGTKSFGMEMIWPAGCVLAAALALSMGVDFFVDGRRKTRMARIRRAFPDMLELLVISSEAGLGPQPALQRVASELSAASPELAEEVLLMVSEMRMTNDRRTAYDKLNMRVPLPEITVFTQTLDQSDTYGTPFSRAMRTLIAEQRVNRLMMIEEKAARLPVIMTIPMIFCIMPAVFVVLVGPAVLSIIDNILTGS